MPKVLVVEDNEPNRRMRARRLQRRGYEISTAADGAEAIDSVRREPPDIILMDMSLPVMHGWAATREIKSDPVTASIPIIALTAHALSGDRDKALQSGCDEFDTKPYDLDRLIGKIETLLAARDGI